MEKSRNKRVVCVVAVVMFLSGVGRSEVVTGVQGSDVTLRFRFNTSRVHKLENIGIYYGTHNKTAECSTSSCPSAFTLHHHTATVYYLLTNLSVWDSGVYYAGLYTGEAPAPESNRVQLQVMEDNTNAAAAPRPSPSPSPGPEVRGSSSGLSSVVLTGAVLCPLLLLALLTVPWCLHRTKEPKRQVQDCSIPTVHERVASARPRETPGSSLVYSVLDFPQRPSQILGLDSDTEYATISYLPQGN